MRIKIPQLACLCAICAGSFVAQAEDSRRVGDVNFRRAAKSLAPDAVTEDWPGFLGMRHDGVSRETDILKEWPDAEPAVVWALNVGEGYASPAVRGDRLVHFHRDGGSAIVECLNAETGARIWQFKYATGYKDRYGFNGGPRSSPVIDGDQVYTFGVEGKLHCLDISDGSVKWSRDTSVEYKVPQSYFGVGSTPLVEGDKLIVQIGAPGGPCVVAFDKMSGKEIWRSGDRWTASYASPVPAEIQGKRRVLVFAGGDSRPPTGGVMSLDPATGRIDFQFPWRPDKYETVNAASPVVVGNQVFVTTSYGKGGVLLNIPPDGSQRVAWTSRRLGSHWSTPIHRDGYLYGFDGERSNGTALVCLEWASGEEMWRKTIEWKDTVVRNGAKEPMSFTPMRASLIWADGVFFCLGEMGHLLSLDLSAKECRVIDRAWLFAARETYAAPVLSKGLLYVVQTRMGFTDRSPARLICFDLRAG